MAMVGVAVDLAKKVPGVPLRCSRLSGIGPDRGRLANVKHFCSWRGPCPGTKISDGKVLSARTWRSTNRVRQALKLAAMRLARNGLALGAFDGRMGARMDKPRATTAVAHKLDRSMC